MRDRVRLTKRQLELIAGATERCGLPLGGIPLFACQLPKGHRGNHAMQLVKEGGRITAIGPRKGSQ